MTMQDKTIIKVLNKKIEDWLITIDDEELKKKIKQDVIVTGGSITSMILGETINDFDIYFRTKETTLKVAKYYVGKFNIKNNVDSDSCYVSEETINNIKNGEEERVTIFISSSGVAQDSVLATKEIDEETDQVIDENENEKYSPSFLSQNAITLTNKLQIIIRFYGEPEDIHKNFDFVHATCYFDYSKQKLSYTLEALRSMQTKKLKYIGSLYPICSLFRMRKFINRGWNISAGEIFKISLQVSTLDLTNTDVLREQLTGVDYLYFQHLVSAIEQYQKSNPDQKITHSYIYELINRIF